MVALLMTLGIPSVAVPTMAEEKPLVSYWSTEKGITEMPVSDGATETYAESDRQWQGLPTIAVTPGGRIWCAWQTGDVIEGSSGPDNYDVMYYSDDGGDSWSSEYMIWDVPDDTIRLFDPRLFYDQFGKLWLVLIRGALKGTYAVEIKNPDCENPAQNLELGEPISWLKAPPAHRPTILSNGRWITPVEVNAKQQVTYICDPNNETGRYPWTTNTKQPAVTAFPDNKKYGEAQIIELQGGTLMMLSRLPKTCGGGMEISYSYDYGENWTPYQADNGVPYITPSSKFHIQRLESGAILMITHATTGSRAQLTAYLSYDDGKTYPYSMMLDDSEIGNSWGVSYPEAAQTQGEHGQIYIVYDAGRYDQKEIRMCVIMEEDIKAGKPSSKYCELRKRISELGGYLNYVGVEENYERYITVEPGTEKSEILELLPTTITLVGEDGSKLDLAGEWNCLDYSNTAEGIYTFTFSKSIIGKAQDRYSLLKAYVTVAKEEESVDFDSGSGENENQKPDGTGQGSGGCASSIGVGGGVSVPVGLIGAALLKKRKYPHSGKNK